MRAIFSPNSLDETSCVSSFVMLNALGGHCLERLGEDEGS